MTVTAQTNMPAARSAPFPETADIETSSADYASRFAGPTGEWMLSLQEHIVLGLLQSCGAKTVLDVGGGHGQLAIPLCRDGFRVSVVGSAPSCRERISGIVDAGQCEFKVGNVIQLPYSDRSFDAVLCFRLVTHCERWETLVGELCRVARQRVIIDYPTSESANKIAPWLFGAKKKLEGNTRTFRLFQHDEIEQVFKRYGYKRARRVGQFFFPMVIHRKLKCRPVSAMLEAMAEGLGLTHRWGSPVILEMVRGL